MKSYLRILLGALYILFAASLFQAIAQAQAIDAAAIDRIMQESLKAWQVPGASLAIVRGNEVVYLKGYGVKEHGSENAVTADTLFAIGSTTKAFTTTAMAMLVDEGKMSWDDQVRKHIPFFRLSDPLANEYVTLRDIVSHRTGLSRNDLLWYNSPWGREEIIRKIGLVKLNRPFRSAYQYQNIMYLSAGYAVGLAANSTFEEFVQKRIFDPLQMTTANFSATAAAKAADHASPHRQTRDKKVEVIPWFNLDNAGPAGSINASARDMSKWVRFQLGDGTFEGKRLVSAANMAEMRSPQTVVPLDKAANPDSTMMSYGLAWFIQDYKGHLMVAHTGGIDGFRARVVLVPNSKLGLVILTNSSVGTSSASMHMAASNSIVDLLLGLSKRDWNAYYGEQIKNNETQAAAFEKRRESRRHKDTRPSRELTSYAGSYEEPAYGRASVNVENGALVLQWSNFKSKLEHYHYDTFLAKENNPLASDLILFRLGPDGEVTSISFLGVEFTKVRGKI
jgi:CubicO group peptidase (beta-lactamase class C family)